MVDNFIYVMAFGAWQTNCYIFGDKNTGSCVVVDPGQNATEELAGLIVEKGFDVEAILLTHGHLDHTWSAPELARVWKDTPIRLHEADTWMWQEPTKGMGTPAHVLEQMGLAWDISGLDDRYETFTDGKKMSLAGLDIEILHTPGHTPGSSCFIVDKLGDDGVMFSGDTLFKRSIGRTDLPGSQPKDMHESLKRIIATQPDDRVVAPGHGELSVMKEELANNPYLLPLL